MHTGITVGLTELSLETFRFEEEDDHEYEIWRKVFSRIHKI